MMQTVQEQAAIRKARKSIVKRGMLKLFLCLFALGNVAIHDDQLRDFALAIADRGGDRFQPPPLSIFVLNAVFQPFAKSAFASFACRLENLEAVIGMDLFKGRSLAQFRRGVAEHSLVSGAVV